MIDRSIVEDLRQKMDIVEVVSDYLTLKKTGANYRAKSPFTNEKTASFFVVPGKNIFKDFSSGKGGDAITFLMEYDGLSFMEAIKILAKKYNIEIPDQAITHEQELAQTVKDRILIANEYAKQYFINNLNAEDNSIGLSYWFERSFSLKTINKFSLGFAPEGWVNLELAATQAGYGKEVLIEAGLLVKNEEKGKTYDFFRNRVIIPIRNLSGKTIGFGGRVLGKAEKEAKYINTKDTPVYNKSEVLFNLDNARASIRMLDNCFLVEGYTDVIGLDQSGIENVVSSSGTALTSGQANLIKRFTNNVTVLFDSDMAGERATIRGLDILFSEGMNVRAVGLPHGEDPDSFTRSRSSSEVMDYLKENSIDFIHYRIKKAGESIRDPQTRAELIRQVVSTIALMPDPITRSVYVTSTANLFEVEVSVINIELKRLLASNSKTIKKVPENFIQEIKELTQKPVEVNPLLHYEFEIIKVLILVGTGRMDAGIPVHEYIESELEGIEFSIEVHKEVYEAYFREIKNEDFNESNLLNTLSPEGRDLVAGMQVQKYVLDPGWAKHNIIVGSEYEGHNAAVRAVVQLKLGMISVLQKQNLDEIRKETDDNKKEELLEGLQRLDEIKIELSKTFELNLIS